jgi:hypothetical protein
MRKKFPAGKKANLNWKSDLEGEAVVNETPL